MTLNASITKIEIILIKNANINLAFGWVTFCDYIKSRFIISKSKTGNIYVGWPQTSSIINGETKYYPQIEFPSDDNRKEINGEILREFNKLVGNVKITSDKENSPIQENPTVENINNSNNSEQSNKPKGIPLVKLRRN